ncbi:MAG: hypothetical protein IJ150_10565 [Bacteroidales bacterium]|nr:hypothetical protein [Bacteroidales bacterium]
MQKAWSAPNHTFNEGSTKTCKENMIVQHTTPYIRAGRRIVNPLALKNLVDFR